MKTLIAFIVLFCSVFAKAGTTYTFTFANAEPYVLTDYDLPNTWEYLDPPGYTVGLNLSEVNNEWLLDYSLPSGHSYYVSADTPMPSVNPVDWVETQEQVPWAWDLGAITGVSTDVPEPSFGVVVLFGALWRRKRRSISARLISRMQK